MPKPGFSPSMAPRTISALIHEFGEFDADRARREYPWASRFVMGLPLAPWQRQFKWDEAQCQRFINSIWTGVHLGTYLVTDFDLREEAGGFQGIEYKFLSNCVIDGQQRLKALELYLTDQLLVPNAAGKLTRWSDVGAVDCRRFGHTIFSRGTLRELDEHSLKSYYDLLNFGGTAHEEHERALVPATGVPEEELAYDLPRG